MTTFGHAMVTAMTVLLSHATSGGIAKRVRIRNKVSERIVIKIN